MRLIRVEVNDFKSIRRSTPFDLDRITCLVGKNESGKTSLLQALYKLNPVVPEHGSFDVMDEYPRSEVEDYRQRTETAAEPAGVVRAVYTLDAAEIAVVEEVYGKGVLRNSTVIVSKGYENRLYVGIETDEAAAVKGLVQGFDLPGDIAGEAAAQRDLRSLKAVLDRVCTESAPVSDSAAKLNELLAAILPDTLGVHVWTHHLAKGWPKFLYFDEYYQMEGHVNIERLKERQAGNKLRNSDRPMLGLIDLARLNLDQLLNADRTEMLVAKLEGASNHLSRQILAYWSQNRHLQVRFDVRAGRPGDPDEMKAGTNLWGRVEDTVHRVSTQLGSRSKGFLWFFSFLAWFSQQRKAKEPLILLLDEPGQYLHAEAQGDLLRYLEAELSPHHQVVYTTHSPFLIDPRHFDRVRIVEDMSLGSRDPLPTEQAGTKVFRDVLDAGRGSLLPLQGALGADIARNLLVGSNRLMVESAADLLYLQAMSGLLQADGREGLDPRWMTTPVGGSAQVVTFAALLGMPNGLNGAALIGFRAQHGPTGEAPFRRKLLRTSRILTYAEFADRDEADIEDLFELPFLLKLVNAEFAKQLPKKIVDKDLPADRIGIVGALEAFFAANPLTGNGTFDRFRPARYFAGNLTALKKSLAAATFDRFEQLFQSLNALIE